MYNVLMSRFYHGVVALCVAAVLSCVFFSCTRKGEKVGDDTGVVDTTEVLPEEVEPAALPTATSGPRPTAVLQAGEYPLWFQITPDGPVNITTIEDAVMSAALIPWPLAPHIRFTIVQGEDLLMAANNSGFIRFSPRTQGAGTNLYYVSGGRAWRQYTVGGFFLFDEKPAVLLYLDDRFLDSDAPPPSPRVLYMPEKTPEALPVPALDVYPPRGGWNVDTLRLSGGFWYFRAVNRTAAQPEILMLRTDDLSQPGEKISLGVFQNAAKPEPLSDAPAHLRNMFADIFAATGGSSETVGVVTVISPEPEFPGIRNFAGRENGQLFFGYYSAAPRFFIAVNPQGAGLYVREGSEHYVVSRFSLPPLPEDFVYTGIGLSGDTAFASWEEQDGYSIGAAGFMALLLTALVK
jgi:hypothetical protein